MVLVVMMFMMLLCVIVFVLIVLVVVLVVLGDVGVGVGDGDLVGNHAGGVVGGAAGEHVKRLHNHVFATQPKTQTIFSMRSPNKLIVLGSNFELLFCGFLIVLARTNTTVGLFQLQDVCTYPVMLCLARSKKHRDAQKKEAWIIFFTADRIRQPAEYARFFIL